MSRPVYDVPYPSRLGRWLLFGVCRCIGEGAVRWHLGRFPL